jgi:HSP20 family protein
MVEPSTKMPIKVSRAARRHEIRAAPHAVDQLHAEVDRVLGDFVHGYWHVPFRRSVIDVEPIWRGDIGFAAVPAVDVVDKDDSYKMTIELPGVDEKEVEIEFSDGTLSVEGTKAEPPEDADERHFLSERRYGSFHRTFRVPDGVDFDKIEATLKSGVLSVTLPKTAEARRRHKRVEVRSA